ncbi:MAG: hypothetical protein ACOZNI_16460 [Myxococcota bacterium]
MLWLVASALAGDPPADKPPVYKFDVEELPPVTVPRPSVEIVFTKPQDTTYQPKLALDEDLAQKTVRDAEKKP